MRDCRNGFDQIHAVEFNLEDGHKDAQVGYCCPAVWAMTHLSELWTARPKRKQRREARKSRLAWLFCR
jgi:hypothetical protein